MLAEKERRAVKLVGGLREPGLLMMEEWTGFDVEGLVIIEGM